VAWKDLRITHVFSLEGVSVSKALRFICIVSLEPDSCVHPDGWSSAKPMKPVEADMVEDRGLPVPDGKSASIHQISPLHERHGSPQTSAELQVSSLSKLESTWGSKQRLVATTTS
jgi:hypothetical protein